MKNVMTAAAVTVAGLLSVPAQAAVLDFEDLSNGVIADGYGGINWSGIWNSYNTAQSPYTASSGIARIYASFGSADQSLSFLTDSIFAGVYAAGQQALGIQAYLDGVLVASMAPVALSATPTYLDLGYDGLVDKLTFVGNPGFYVLDDLDYSEAAVSPVPVPAAGLMLVAGLGGLAALRRNRKRA